MRRLIIVALGALILLSISVSDPQGSGLRTNHCAKFRSNLFSRGALSAATSPHPGSPSLWASANERGIPESAQEGITLEPGKLIER